MRKAVNLIGQRFGRLVAIEPTKKRSGGSVVWRCICDCGNKAWVSADHLRSGNIQSCGCLQRERVSIHGLYCHPLYPIWKDMNARCYNPKCKNYKWYGARGISVCEEWQNDPTLFIKWAMDTTWEKGLTLERKDNNGNYNSENCIFVTYLEQANNTRNLKFFMAYGPKGQIQISKNQSSFAREHDLDPSNIGACLHGRRKQHKGWKFTLV